MPQIPQEADAPAETDESIWQECDARLRIAMEAESDNRARGIEALQFGDGQQWPDDLYNQRRIDKRPSLTINHTNTFVRRVVNNMRQQRPRIKVHPVGDGANQDKADVLSGIIRHIENRSHADHAYDTAGESAVRIGWGYARVLTEYSDPASFDLELKIAAIRNTFTVYMDPSAVLPAGEDADWVIITERMKRQEYKRQYPKAENVEWSGRGIGDDHGQWETKTELRLAEYYRLRKTTEWLYRMSNGMAMYQDDIDKLAPQLEKAKVTYALDESGKPVKRASFRQRVEWFKLNGRKIVDRRTLKTEPLPDQWIPVVRCEGNVLDLNGAVKRKGMIADMMDPARMLNYWKTCETEQLALASKAPWIGQSEHFDGHPEWADANQKPYSRLTYNAAFLEQPDGSKTPLPPPARQEGIPVPAGFVQASQGAFQDLMGIAGMPHEPMADMPGQVISGKALRERQALSDIGHFQYYDNQTRFINQIGRILVQLTPHTYSEARMQRIIGEDGVPSMVPINTAQPSKTDPTISEIKNDLSIGRYDVVMDTGPGYDTKRLEGAEAMIDLLKTPLGEAVVKVGADLVVRNMDFAGASDLADRLMPMNPEGMQKLMENLPKDAQSVVTAMYQQMQAVQKELQDTKLELKYKTSTELGWMHVEKDKIAARKEEVRQNNETKQLDTHVRSVTARDVAEIQVGGELLNTHVEAAHNKEAAEIALKTAEKAESKPN